MKGKLVVALLLISLGIGGILWLSSGLTPSVHLEAERLSDDLSDGSVVLSAKVRDRWTEILHDGDLSGIEVKFTSQGLSLGTRQTDTEGQVQLEKVLPEGNHSLQASFRDADGMTRRSNTVGVKVSSSKADKLMATKVLGGMTLDSVCTGSFVLVLVLGAAGLFFSWLLSQNKAEQAAAHAQRTQHQLVQEQASHMQDLRSFGIAGLLLADRNAERLARQASETTKILTGEFGETTRHAISEMSANQLTALAQLGEVAGLLAQGASKPRAIQLRGGNQLYLGNGTKQQESQLTDSEIVEEIVDAIFREV